MKKRLFALFLACLMTCTCSTLAIAYEPQVYAAATNESSGVTVKYFPSETTGVTVKNFPNETVGVSTRVINTNDTSGITVSPIMSYAEMLDYMVNVKHFSREEAIRLLPKTRASDGNRILSVELSVENKPSYKPKLEFYCQISVGDGVWGIQEIYLVQMNRSSNGITKQFSGDITTFLRGPERIEYIVNGDFYDYGTTTFTGGGSVEIKIGENAKISGTVSWSSQNNWYGYCYNNAIKKFT